MSSHKIRKSNKLKLNPNFVLAASHVFLPEEWGLVRIMWEEMEAKTGLGPVMGLGTALGSLSEERQVVSRLL